MKNSILHILFENLCEDDSAKIAPNLAEYCKQFYKLTEHFKSRLNDDLIIEFEEILNLIFNLNNEEELFSFKQGFNAGYALANELNALNS